MKSKKSALLKSLIALLLCLSMLVGTTFAWFTDSVSTGINTIAAGNLDVELYHSNAAVREEKVESDTMLFLDLQGDPILWEPGVVSYENLRVRNEGDLALAYQMAITTANENYVIDGNDQYGLSQILKVGVVEGGITAADRAGVVASVEDGNWTTLSEFVRNGSLMAEGKGESEEVWGLVVYWEPGDDDNRWNLNNGKQLNEGDVLQINLGINLIATQEMYESDSFGNDYDVTAKTDVFPVMTLAGAATVTVKTDGENKVAKEAVLTSGQITATVPEGVQMEAGATALTLTVSEMESTGSNITLDDGEAMRSLDVHVAGIDSTNTVPVIVDLGKVMAAGLNLGNYALHHVENGTTVPMTKVDSLADLDEHNEFFYDPATGNVTVAMKSFSEITCVVDSVNAWEGNFNYDWYNADAKELIIANADQLAAFGAIVGGMKVVTAKDDENYTYTYSDEVIQDSFSGKTVKLISDINLGDDEEHNNSNLIFYPIGYWNDEGTYEKSSKSISSGFYTFNGTFDGNGHTIANFYQNTWEMKGDNEYYDRTLQYYRDGMGLFGRVYGGTVKNLTVKNFKSDGEYTTTGVIAAYADGATFENIAITDCNPRVYNIGNGGIVGCVGWYAKEANLKTTFKNITVDNSNKISALWGSYDVACGGIVGQYYPTSGQSSAGKPVNGGVSFENCHIAAQMDVYNDVCGNYMYYAYRYAGMMIGSIRENTTNEDGKTIPNMTGISATGCTVNYGDWNDYYYCEFEKNGHPSYAAADEYKFSRVPDSELKFTDSNGNGKVDADERASVTGCTHAHSKAEDNQAIYLPFHQLFTGYGWGVNSIGLEQYSGIVTNLGITEGDQEESVHKFFAKTSVQKIEDETITLGALFEAIPGVEINVSAIQVSVNGKTNDGAVITGEYKPNTEDWTAGTISISSISGRVEIAIQDYNFCKPTTLVFVDGVRVYSNETAGFKTLFANDNFTYRVGNKNPVKLSSLFEAITEKIGVVAVEISGENASGTYNSSTEWKESEIIFSGTGLVNVIIRDSVNMQPIELTLEVVDAVNVTSATNATANNVVLLNDCSFGSLEVSGGYTLYGNGFTMTCGSDSAALDMGYSFVTLNNGALDNVQIVTPNFDYAVLYKSNLDEMPDDRKQTTDRTRYYNVKSGVMVSGNSQILNSRISGARAAVNVTGGNCLIDNSRIEGGAVASVLVGAANSLTLRDVTLVQKPTASTYDSSKTLMGFSVLFVCDANGDAAPVTLEGTLVQNAWVDEYDKQYVPSAGQSIISTVLGKTEYLHDLNNDGTKESLNLGFAYLPESLTSKVNTTTITDNRTNKDDVPYDYAEVSILNGKTYVYSYKNTTNNTADSFKTESDYEPNKQGDIITVTYSDTANGLESGKFFGTDGWVYELNVDLDKLSGYALDFSKLSMSVNGVAVTDFKVNGNAKPTSPVAVTAGGTTYTLTATVNGKEYTAIYKVTGTETSKESPSKISGPTTAGFGVAKSYGGDWSGAADVLTGVKIKYWSVAENKYDEFDFSNFTVPGDAGKLNGTNSYWEYTHTNNDFTLKVTNTVAIHSGKSVYGMPIRGTDGKLYFTISSTNGYVGSGTTSRAITMQYEFTDNNGGEKLTFTHTFNIGYNKDDQYSYSELSGSGKLTKLEASSSGGGGSCLAAGTMITLENGSKRAVENLRKGDKVMTVDHLTGKVTSSEVIIVVKTAQENYYKNTFVFDDGTELVTINEHGIFDLDLNKYVNIDHENYEQFIGHRFVSVDSRGKIGTKKLVDVTTVRESGYKYDIVTDGTLDYVAEDTLSVTHVLVDVINGFDFGKNLKFDQQKMQEDIAKYGLYTYDEWAEYCDISVFEEYNIPVMKVGISKGLYTKEYIIGLINTYVLDESVQIID